MTTTIEKSEVEQGAKINLDALREKLRMAKESKEEKFVKEEDLIAEAVEMVRGNKKLNENFLQKERDFNKNGGAPESKPLGYHDQEKQIEEEKFALIDKLMGESVAQLKQYNEATSEAMAALRDEHISEEDKKEIEKLLEEIEPAINEEDAKYSKLQQQQFDLKKEKNQNQERRAQIDTGQRNASYQPEILAAKTVLEVYKNSGKLINKNGKSDSNFEDEFFDKVDQGVKDAEQKEYREEQNKKQQEYNEQQKKKQEEADLGLDKWKIESEVLYNKYKSEYENEIAKFEVDFNTLLSHLPEGLDNNSIEKLKAIKEKELEKREGVGSKLFGWKPGKLNEAKSQLTKASQDRFKLVRDLMNKSELACNNMRKVVWELFTEDGARADNIGQDIKDCRSDFFTNRLYASTEKIKECDAILDEYRTKQDEVLKLYRELHEKMKAFGEEPQKEK